MHQKSIKIIKSKILKNEKRKIYLIKNIDANIINCELIASVSFLMNVRICKCSSSILGIFLFSFFISK